MPAACKLESNIIRGVVDGFLLAVFPYAQRDDKLLSPDEPPLKIVPRKMNHQLQRVLNYYRGQGTQSKKKFGMSWVEISGGELEADFD